MSRPPPLGCSDPIPGGGTDGAGPPLVAAAAQVPAPSVSSVVHPEQPRVLTVREAAAAQTFPDDFM